MVVQTKTVKNGWVRVHNTYHLWCFLFWWYPPIARLQFKLSRFNMSRINHYWSYGIRFFGRSCCCVQNGLLHVHVVSNQTLACAARRRSTFLMGCRVSLWTQQLALDETNWDTELSNQSSKAFQRRNGISAWFLSLDLQQRQWSFLAEISVKFSAPVFQNIKKCIDPFIQNFFSRWWK